MRFVFTALTTASLVLCLAACAFRWRSRSIDEFVYTARKGHMCYSLDSRQEGIHFDSIGPWPCDQPPEVISYRRDRPVLDVMVIWSGSPPVELWDRWGVKVRTGTYGLPLSPDGSVLKTLPGQYPTWPYVMSPPMACRLITINHWWLAGLAAVLPAAWCAQRLRRRRVAKLGLCAHCGYDLRASVDRCPECGRPIRVTCGTSQRAAPPPSA